MKCELRKLCNKSKGIALADAAKRREKHAVYLTGHMARFYRYTACSLQRNKTVDSTDTTDFMGTPIVL